MNLEERDVADQSPKDDLHISFSSLSHCVICGMEETETSADRGARLLRTTLRREQMDELEPTTVTLFCSLIFHVFQDTPP